MVLNKTTFLTVVAAQIIFVHNNRVKRANSVGGEMKGKKKKIKKPKSTSKSKIKNYNIFKVDANYGRNFKTKIENHNHISSHLNNNKIITKIAPQR